MTSRFCTLTSKFFSLDVMTSWKFRSIENPAQDPTWPGYVGFRLRPRVSRVGYIDGSGPDWLFAHAVGRFGFYRLIIAGQTNNVTVTTFEFDHIQSWSVYLRCTRISHFRQLTPGHVGLGDVHLQLHENQKIRNLTPTSQADFYILNCYCWPRPGRVGT